MSARKNSGHAPLTYFPERKDPSVRGGPKVGISFKAPEQLGQYIEGIRKRGYSLSTVMIDLLSFARDVMEHTDVMVRKLQFEADERNLSLGALIGELASEKIRELYPERPGEKNKK